MLGGVRATSVMALPEHLDVSRSARTIANHELLSLKGRHRPIEHGLTYSFSLQPSGSVSCPLKPQVDLMSPQYRLQGRLNRPNCGQVTFKLTWIFVRTDGLPVLVGCRLLAGLTDRHSNESDLKRMFTSDTRNMSAFPSGFPLMRDRWVCGSRCSFTSIRIARCALRA